MSDEKIIAPLDDGPILLSVEEGSEIRIPGRLLGLMMGRKGENECLYFLEYHEEGHLQTLWSFESDTETGAANGFDRALCSYLARRGYAAALAHPFSRGVAVDEEGGPRMLAKVDPELLLEIVQEIDAVRDAARHFAMLRDAYPVRNWWKGEETCWVHIPPGYDYRHLKTILDADPPVIREDQRAYMQLSFYKRRMDDVEIWEPEVIVTLDQEPVYDLETDTIPGLDVMVLPGGELNRGHEGETDRLVRDLLRTMPNDDEPFRWRRGAVEHAMRWLPVVRNEVEDCPAPL